jgi:putative ABC transport system ATP-binding protein
MNAAMLNRSAELAVHCRAISKSYGAGLSRSSVLAGVDLDATCGQMTFICGPSGCGKTTLLSIIAGVLEPDDGRVDIFSTPMRSLSRRARAQFRSRNIGFVLQQFNLLPALDLVENVSVPLLITGQTVRSANKAALAALERVGIAEHAMRHPSELSVGQQQRVAIARAIVHAPRLIICDEPTGSLDGQAGTKIMELLQDLSLTINSAVLVVTHDSRAMAFADRTYALSNGSLIHKDVPEQQVAVQ